MWIILVSGGCSWDDFLLDQDEGEWAIPLINGQIDAQDLLNQSVTFGEIRVLNNGLLSIHYSGELLQKTKKDIFFPIPGILPIPLLDTFYEVTLPVVNNMIVHQAILANGNYWFSYSHQHAQDINLRIWVPEMSVNSHILNHHINIPFLGQTPTVGLTTRFPLDNIVLRPVNNKIGLHYQALTAAQQSIPMSSVFFIYDQIDFKYIEGFIGQNIYDLRKDSIEFDLYDGFVQGGLYINDPQITMTVTNSFGFPAKALVNEFAVQTADGSLRQFTSTLLDAGMYFNYPSLPEQGQAKTTRFVFTSSNSNVREIFNAQAKRIIYDIDALSNPALIPDSSYFIMESSAFAINVTVDLPLSGKITDYPAERVFQVNAEKLNELKEGFLRIETDNGLPLTAKAQIFLLDQSGILIDTLFTTATEIFKSASTNPQGSVISSTLHTLDIAVPAHKISAWSKTKTIRVRIHFNSPSEQPQVQILNSSKMNFRLGFIGKLKSK